MIGEPYSPLQPGSEFKPVSSLDSVFKGHPCGLWLSRQIANRISIPLVPIPEEDS
jgi:hypothetical protein